MLGPHLASVLCPELRSTDLVSPLGCVRPLGAVSLVCPQSCITNHPSCASERVSSPVRYPVEAAPLSSSAALLPDVYGAHMWSVIIRTSVTLRAFVDTLPLKERSRRSTYPRTPALNVEITRQRGFSATTGNIERGGAGVDTTFPRSCGNSDSRLFLPRMDTLKQRNL